MHICMQIFCLNLLVWSFFELYFECICVIVKKKQRFVKSNCIYLSLKIHTTYNAEILNSDAS